jgi:PAS domain S-box-containing protein
MLAFSLPIPVLYDGGTVLLSLLAAICASAVALFVVSRRSMGLFRVLIGSSWHNTVLKDNAGTIVGTLSSGEDITERKRVEQERERIFTLSRDMLCIAGFDGYFKKLNPAWERTLGYTEADLLAQPYIEFIHPDDRQSTLAESKNVHSGSEVIAVENRYRCKDGSYRWFMWNAIAVVEDQLIYATARDITERKRSEEVLQKTNAELRQALQEVKVLSGFIPICASCKKIRNDQGYWQQIETYIQDHSEALVSHGMCQERMKKFHPEFSVEVE